MRELKIISWNVNGLRSALCKGLGEYITVSGADIILLQEVKVGAPLDEMAALCKKLGLYAHYNFAQRKGYSGTLCLYRNKPKLVFPGIAANALDSEGRAITLCYDSFHIVNVYVPNSQAELARQYYRMSFDEAFREYLCKISENIPVIIGGDFNVAHHHLDTFPENLRAGAYPTGFMSEERDAMEQLLGCGFVDAFRYLYPEKEGAYTWWPNHGNSREQNRGWRIDYFLVSESLKEKIEAVTIRSDIFGSDHCPIELEIQL